jgi:hypothetical protein
MRLLPVNLMVSLMVISPQLRKWYPMGLTAVAIKAAKGRAKQYKLADSDGLYLLVKPTGLATLWFWSLEIMTLLKETEPVGQAYRRFQAGSGKDCAEQWFTACADCR